MSVVHVSKTSVRDFCAGHGVVDSSTEKVVIDLGSAGLPVTKHLTIRADINNTDAILIGRPGNAAAGFVLRPGETSPPLFVENVNDVALIAASGSQAFSWVKQ
jgi:hypothetical protein